MKVKILTCGCGTCGCVCVNHQDVPRGRPAAKCDLHRTEAEEGEEDRQSRLGYWRTFDGEWIR